MGKYKNGSIKKKWYLCLTVFGLLLAGMSMEALADTKSYCDIYGHSYRPEYYWGEDGSWALVSLICRNDSSHRTSSVMTITSEVEKKATCTTKGLIIYTGTAEVDGIIYADSIDMETAIAPSNHSGKVTVKNAKKATSKTEGYTGDKYCASCGKKISSGKIIPKKGTAPATDTSVSVKKSVTVELGKKVSIKKIVNKTSAFQKMELPGASQYKKYLTVNRKTGTITTKKYYKTKIKKSIPVKVTAGGKVYTVKVKIKIPAPKVKVTKKRIHDSKGIKYRYAFQYNIKGASRIKIRMKKGGSTAINEEFDKYISKPKSDKNSFIQYSVNTMKKLKNKVTFNIVAYYGKNQSEILTVTK